MIFAAHRRSLLLPKPSAPGEKRRMTQRDAFHAMMAFERPSVVMFRAGGYLPTLDHHVPLDVQYADFRYYLERCRDMWHNRPTTGG